MKIALIGGYGHEIPRHFPGAEVVRACDRFDDAAGRRGEAQGQTVYPNPEALLEAFTPDLVYIGTVYARQGALALEMLERGFPVVSEKPLAADRATLERLREATASGERRIIAELAMRWAAPFVALRELVLSGGIGEPVHLQAQKSYRFGASRPDFYRSRETFGGMIPWVASHAIDYAAYCTGLKYEAVTALHGNRSRPDYPGMEDHATMLFEMTGGVPCVISADFLRPDSAASHSDDRLRITGTSGVVEIRHGEVILANALGERRWKPEVAADHGPRMARDMVEAALYGTQTTISVAESLHTTEAALAARESADGAGRVRIG